jgi:hypothetical protein
MKNLVTLVMCLLLLTACGSPPKPETRLVYVKPSGPVHVDCERTPDPKPQLQKKSYSKAESARAYKRLNDYTIDELNSASRCRTWARGQR